MAKSCKDELHNLIAEELTMKRQQSEEGEGEGENWNGVMERSFNRMDEQVTRRRGAAGAKEAFCRCELQPPLCDLVGSTAVVAVVSPDKIVVANCGDSRAVLCRGGKAIALSTDHKVSRRSIQIALFFELSLPFLIFILLFVRSRIDPTSSRESSRPAGG